MKVFGGVEGGATHSTLSVIDDSGKLLVEVKGGVTNQWLIGVEKCASNILAMIDEAKASFGSDLEFAALGISCSGLNRVEDQNVLRDAIEQIRPGTADKYAMCDDTMGSLLTLTNSGGILIIAGTGSNCYWMASTVHASTNGHFGDGIKCREDSPTDLPVYRCGGWGHMIGDEGSAYDIARKCINTIYRTVEGYPSRHGHTIDSTRPALDVVRSHFGIVHMYDILPLFYRTFSKDNVASLTKELAALADGGDEFCQWLFAWAGRRQAKQVIGSTSCRQPGDFPVDSVLTIGCVGSVWKSWKHLQSGFVEEMKSLLDDSGNAVKYELKRITGSCAVGAAWLGAANSGADVTLDRQSLTETFFSN